VKRVLLIAMGIAITVIGAAGGAAVGWYGTFLVRGAASGGHAVTGVAVGVCLLLLFCVGLRWMWLRLSDRPQRVRHARRERREPRAPVASEELSSVDLWDVRPPQQQDTEPGRPAASPSR
jgi:hypothetical protein